MTAEANVALAPEEVSFSLGSPLDSLPSVNFGQQIQLYPIEAFDLPSDLQLESGAVYWLQENILHQLDEFLVGSLAARSGPFSFDPGGIPELGVPSNLQGYGSPAFFGGSVSLEPIANRTRACLIPFFNVINQVKATCVIPN